MQGSRRRLKRHRFTSRAQKMHSYEAEISSGSEVCMTYVHRRRRFRCREPRTVVGSLVKGYAYEAVTNRRALTQEQCSEEVHIYTCPTSLSVCPSSLRHYAREVLHEAASRQRPS